jgi:putative spermidine/putrescine transport system permease protein
VKAAGRASPLKQFLARLPAYLVLAFLLAPLAVVVASSFTAGELAQFPPKGLSLRWYETALRQDEFLVSLGNSAMIAAITTVIAVVLGYIAALVISRNPRGARLLSVVALGPLFVASAVLGLAFLIIFSRLGMLGSPQGLLIAYTVISLPYTTRMISGVLVNQGVDAEIAARVYGATPRRAIFGVTVPLSAQGVFTAAIYSFVHTFDESVIINFIGSVRFQTFPGVMVARLRETFDPVASVYATLILVATVLLVFLASRLFGLDQLSAGGSGRTAPKKREKR